MLSILFALGMLATPFALYKHFKMIADTWEKDRERERKRQRDKAAAAEKFRNEEARAAAIESFRREQRDLDQQDAPFLFQIGRHGNETLALRYGIANDVNARSGVPSRSILLRKLRPAGMIGADGQEIAKPNLYLVELTRFRNRQALAVIVKGEEFVRTFLPMRRSWFDANRRLEEKLKGNATFTLKEIASFHILHSKDAL